jgi:tetratricopeptide (TPR) repeat protein
MSELRLETLTMPTADVGAVNPLPPLFAGRDLHAVVDAGEADEELRRNIGYGRVDSVLPYLLQDGYGRDRQPAEHKVAVLENDVLRATFLLGFGGRLWSLVHKPAGRELLYRNPVLQPANLALRNAWFAGGVEWNIGTIGHSPTTCEPLHAARVLQPDGTPVLRMYEFERLREVVFQVDAWLPEGSLVLLVHVRIVNPNDVETPMYWWSNVAVPQADDVRVLAPADVAWQFADDSSLRRVPIPVLEGQDCTYTTRASGAADYFFAIADDQRRWIAALDGRGSGLVQTSTDRLRGRKLFLWGKGPGGGHWQEWLAQPGQEYLEIQAGLARTQLEHLPMPARASWSWVEAYGLLESDADAAHGDDWSLARAAVSRDLEALIPRADLDGALTAATAWADAAPVEVLNRGSGWGALERRLRERDGDDSLSLPGTPFGDEMLGPEQEAWAELVRTGRMPSQPAEQPPSSYQTSPRWLPLLEAADGWLPALHLGVALAHAGDRQGATDAWVRSLADQPTAWAWRNLAVLAEAEGDLALAVRRYRAAVALRGDLAPLRRELVDVLLAAGDGVQAGAVIEAASAEQRRLGRFRLAEIRAALLTGDLDHAGRILAEGVVLPDVREGEPTLHEVWFDYQVALAARQERRPVDADLVAQVRATVPIPADLDFRMQPSTPRGTGRSAQGKQ